MAGLPVPQAHRHLPQEAIVSVIDFAENYSFQVQNEIQSMHWYSDQVTILVHHDEHRDIVKELHFYISDDKDHGTVFVQHCLVDVHYAWLKAKGITLDKHVFFSDGAASQFKSAHAFYFDTRHLGLTEVPAEWNFFESGHGKGEHDGMGALVKSALRKWQLLDGDDAPRLTNAKEVVELLQARLKTAAPSSFPSRADQRAETARYFHLIEMDSVKDLPKLCCKTVPGTRKIHSLKGSSNPNNPTVLFHKELSCFCGPCQAGNDEVCEEVARVGQWLQANLEPTGDIPDALEGDEDEGAIFGGDYDDLSGLLC
ncbi:hypothetical protein KFL_010490010 [Klebsormidium nitens]|uniref:Uncharacterized protein n=1 Tax=Klebsormidium nitens TaxID=105231 RepID=A0A1Y1IP90_KLENI|nr:hypothetical protein KFL_010490010 [Klebsormidium nitens]|eukprot:GAQ92554.1 hypothetical protein KFL_010490010 [Klebsormidium nitens]